MGTDLHPASYWHHEDDGIRCTLCPHHCLIKPRKTGHCRVRKSVGGQLYSRVYGNPSGLAVDPIEKKPLYHFLPGARTLSYATVGCNFRCQFCQNHTLSQVNREIAHSQHVPARAIVDEAEGDNCRIIAHTYTEPTIYFEYALDIAREANRRGIRNVFVSNGFTSRQPLEDIAPYLDAANIDLKAFDDETYRRRCGGQLQPVLDTIKSLVDLGVWVEVTTLVVPGMNDDSVELAGIAAFIASVGKEIPWHISRFHPQYQMSDVEPTRLRVMHEARDVGREAGLKHIYLGNVPGGHNQWTHCPACGEILLERSGFGSKVAKMKDGRCGACGAAVAGVWR